MSPLVRIALIGLICPLSASAKDKADEPRSLSGSAAAGVRGRLAAGDVAGIYGERQGAVGGAVPGGGAIGTKADANLPSRRLPESFRTALGAPPKPAGGTASAPKGALAEAGAYLSEVAVTTRDFWFPPEAPLGKLVANPSFSRRICLPGNETECSLEVMTMSENTPHAKKVTELVDYGEIDGELFVVPKWWEFWKEDAPPSSDEVAQGGVGDCFLMASLAAVAHKEPGLLKTMIRRHKKTGAAWVTFYSGPGKPVLVGPVDNLFPVYKKGVKRGEEELEGKSSFAQPAGGPPPPLWPLLIEKAYTINFRGSSYAELNRGGHPSSAMTHITGRPSRWFVVDPTEPPFKARVDFSELVKWDNNGQPIVMGSKSGPTEGCTGPPTVPEGKAATDSACTDPLYDPELCKVSGEDPVCKAGRTMKLAKSHAYWVKKVDAASKTVTLANPWGSTQPTVELPWARLQESLYVVHVNDK